MKTQMGSVKDLNKLAGLKEWLNGEGREQEFKCDSGEPGMGTASANKMGTMGRLGLMWEGSSAQHECKMPVGLWNRRSLTDRWD